MNAALSGSKVVMLSIPHLIRFSRSRLMMATMPSLFSAVISHHNPMSSAYSKSSVSLETYAEPHGVSSTHRLSAMHVRRLWEQTQSVCAETNSVVTCEVWDHCCFDTRSMHKSDQMSSLSSVLKSSRYRWEHWSSREILCSESVLNKACYPGQFWKCDNPWWHLPELRRIPVVVHVDFIFKNTLGQHARTHASRTLSWRRDKVELSGRCKKSVAERYQQLFMLGSVASVAIRRRQVAMHVRLRSWERSTLVQNRRRCGWALGLKCGLFATRKWSELGLGLRPLPCIMRHLPHDAWGYKCFFRRSYEGLKLWIIYSTPLTFIQTKSERGWISNTSGFLKCLFVDIMCLCRSIAICLVLLYLFVVGILLISTKQREGDRTVRWREGRKGIVSIINEIAR